ncbi:MAG: hypothetical protein ACK4VO_01805 [Pseudobdellovibrio sp.]
MKYFILLILLVFNQFLIAGELNANQMRFHFMSTEGDVYTLCASKKGSQPHQFIVDCQQVNRIFYIHMLLNRYDRQFEDQLETTYEFHYWVNEPDNGYQSNTQSTWLTVKPTSEILKIVSYVGLDNDAHQLRVEIKF